MYNRQCICITIHSLDILLNVISKAPLNPMILQKITNGSILFQIIRKPQYPNGEMQTNGSLASGFLRNRCCVALTTPFCGMVTVTTGQFIWRIQVCIISLIDAGQFKFFCTTTCSDESNCLQLNTSTDFMNIYDI